MKIHQYALWAVLATMLICLNGCESTTVLTVVDSNKDPSSWLAEHIKPESKLEDHSVYSPYDKPTIMEDTPIQPMEPASTVSPTPSPQITPIQPLDPVSASNPTPSPQATVAPLPESVSDPSPTPLAKDESEFIYPIRTFDDETRLCLTFDDGGNKKAVEAALEVLKKQDVQCTFFVVGKYLKTNATLWKQAIEDGHLICNHTQNHKWLTQLNDDDAKKEILEWESTVLDILGQDYLDKMKREFPFIRLPGGAGNDSKRILRIVSELGYIPVGWNIESYYAVLRHHDLKTEPTGPIANEVLSHITKKAKGGSIILLHFNQYDTARLDDIITEIKEKELTFQLLSESLNY
ncbi:MAG TPA: polysaccharide deacetylase family protein [Thermoclostridium sp.]|nr:polysaccharide deacetylase family protein [Thermoclostridium sp.]